MRSLFPLALCLVFSFSQSATANDTVAKQRLNTAFEGAAALTGTPVRLLRGVCWVESKHDVHAKRPKDGKDNAMSFGICQIKLGTARLYGFHKVNSRKIMKPELNVLIAAVILREEFNKHGSWKVAMTSFNRGPYHQSLTDNNSYVRKVLKAMEENR